MKKYYVNSGDLKYIVLTETPEIAINKALHHFKYKIQFIDGIGLASSIIVNEHGFEILPSDLIYDTYTFLVKNNMEKLFIDIENQNNDEDDENMSTVI